MPIEVTDERLPDPANRPEIKPMLTVGQSLFKALESHPAKTDGDDSDTHCTEFKRCWSGIMATTRTEDVSKASAHQLLALCAYSSYFRCMLLTTAQQNQITVMLNDAKAKWTAITSLPEGSYQLYADVRYSELGPIIDAELDVDVDLFEDHQEEEEQG